MNDEKDTRDEAKAGANVPAEQNAAPETGSAQDAGNGGGGGQTAPERRPPRASRQDISAAFGDAMGSGGGSGEGGADADADARRRQSHSDSVYNGRLGAAMRENNDLRRRLAEQERRIAELEARASAAPAAADGGGGGGDDEDVGDGTFDEATRKGIARMIERRARAFESRIGQMDAELEQWRDGAARRAFAETQARSAEGVERRWPGLLHDIAGSLREAWRDFCASEDPVTGTSYGASLHEATRRGAESAAVRVFEEFVRSSDLGGRYGGGAAFDAPPSRTLNPADPLSGRGGAGGGQVWPSRDAILEAMDKVQLAERRGQIDRAERARRMKELDDALRAGRYAR